MLEAAAAHSSERLRRRRYIAAPICATSARSMPPNMPTAGSFARCSAASSPARCAGPRPCGPCSPQRRTALVECGPGKVLTCSQPAHRARRGSACVASRIRLSLQAALAPRSSGGFAMLNEDLALVTGASRGIGRAIALALGGRRSPRRRHRHHRRRGRTRLSGGFSGRADWRAAAPSGCRWMPHRSQQLVADLEAPRVCRRFSSTTPASRATCCCCA